MSACSWILSIFFLSDDLQKYHTISRHVRWGKVLDLYNYYFADHRIKLRSESQEDYNLTARFLANITDMFTECQFVFDGYAKNFQIIRWFNFVFIEFHRQFIPMGFLEVYGSIVGNWYFWGLTCSRFSLYHCDTASVCLLRVWVAFNISLSLVYIWWSSAYMRVGMGLTN